MNILVRQEGERKGMRDEVKVDGKGGKRGGGWVGGFVHRIYGGGIFLAEIFMQ